MWLGAQDGMLYVHSSVGRWHECLHQVLLPDAVLAIVHVEARVVVALANAQLAVFRRQTDGQWDLNSYHLVTLGDRNHSIRWQLLPYLRETHILSSIRALRNFCLTLSDTTLMKMI